MKKAILLFATCMFIANIYASDIRLVVQKVDNHGLVPGNTYRVYAEIPEEGASLHIVYGDQQHPLQIQSTEAFYQHPYGVHSAAGVNSDALISQPGLAFDSWITLGYQSNQNNDMWDLGVDFAGFDGGGSIYATNGGWFLIPTDEKCTPENHLVLIAQFTTTGVASGTLNLQGFTASREIWKKNDLTFSTSNAEIFGCMDQRAVNYNSDATFNDGNCVYKTADAESSPVAEVAAENSWDVFPNPLRDNLINIQFRSKIDLTQTPTRVDIVDMTGRIIGSHQLSAASMIGGNKVTIDQSLASGSYKVVLVQNGHQESKTIVVEK